MKLLKFFALGLLLATGLRAQPFWGIAYNTYLSGGASNTTNYDVRHSDGDAGVVDGPVGVQFFPVALQSTASAAATNTSGALASGTSFLAADPGLYYGHVTGRAQSGTDSAGSYFSTFVGGAPNFATRDSLTIYSSTLTNAQAFTMRVSLTLSLNGAILVNGPGGSTADYNGYVSANVGGASGSLVAINFTDATANGTFTASNDYSLTFGGPAGQYSINSNFYIGAEARANVLTPAYDLGYDITSAASVQIAFYDTNGNLLTDTYAVAYSAFDYGQANIASAQALSAIPEPAAWSAFAGLGALGLIAARRFGAVRRG